MFFYNQIVLQAVAHLKSDTYLTEDKFIYLFLYDFIDKKSEVLKLEESSDRRLPIA